MRLRAPRGWLISLSLLAACDDGGEAPDRAAGDAGAPDVSVGDFGPADLGAADLGAADLGLTDLGLADLGPDDEGLADADLDPGFPEDPAPLEDGELRPGGDTTTDVLGAGAFVQAAGNLTTRRRARFEAGLQFFRLVWVPAPGRADLDGLGPNFHTDTCLGCHPHNGRAVVQPPEVPTVGVLLRLADAEGRPDPQYGGQLQPLSLPGVEAQGQPTWRWAVEETITLTDEVITLRRPIYTVDGPGGPLAPETGVSPRLGQQLIGQGLLEAIEADDLYAAADPEDADGDGISGRVALLAGGEIGRFGWKAAQPSVFAQTAAAFHGDLGITSDLFPDENCAPWQGEACALAATGGAPEIQGPRLEATAAYLRLLGVPPRRDGDDPEVLWGKALFSHLGCVGCHQPSHVTGAGLEPEVSDQRVWAYTDLLLHDMGPGLSEGAGEGAAAPAEWRTPPLWGLGLVEEINGALHLLHDGRAHSWAEAILWHGGEAERSRALYAELPTEARAALHRFLGSL